MNLIKYKNLYITLVKKRDYLLCDYIKYHAIPDLSNGVLTKFIFLLFSSHQQINTHCIHNVQSLQVPKYFVKSRHYDDVIMSHDQSILFGIIAYHGAFDSCLITNDSTLSCRAIFQEKLWIFVWLIARKRWIFN